MGIIHEYEGRCLLVNFEYAKRRGEGAVHEVKTVGACLSSSCALFNI